MEPPPPPPPPNKPPLNEYTLTPELLLNLTNGHDFIKPLTRFNGPTKAVLVLFEFISPLSLVLNAFVLVSCLGSEVSRIKLT